MNMIGYWKRRTAVITIFNRKKLAQMTDYDQIQKIGDRLKNMGIEYYISQKNLSSDVNRRAYTGITQNVPEVIEYTIYVSGSDQERAESCL